MQISWKPMSSAIEMAYKHARVSAITGSDIFSYGQNCHYLDSLQYHPQRGYLCAIGLHKTNNFINLLSDSIMSLNR
ncbi:hypothetical protein E1A91_A10G064200v1 [Gossypium mustelinum]|uniref:Uncharacterized protein n=3 Tax=Gossypium TaxID=3633 RepID=A0A5J5U023_GOSBA|nr:hypothetical protein ES319_A10G062800v1 [Gossypium barbadense]TYG97810.1 hypothetical protein ES288_A10G067400v1 [Gossypium darwinii]TYJ13631.1 hypothetical protein E1A91_A10G064200v1 [Gossypium mustelinum]KAB2061083.1 hypothetical protein ES319_A10G062800v1 [Gossypium barbadense]TYG97812.1 hypothetical protein ES288_A10G067400v1 [Gossypium darwinii]